MARAGRTADYLALLRRLREEQPELYLECFGFYDEDLVVEALCKRRREEIPRYLSLFRQHPVKHIDHFSRVVDLLAWRGCEAELQDLLQPTAQTIADSSDVLGGEFGLQWLANLATFPFLEAGDDSEAGLDRILKAASAVGLIEDSDSNARAWYRSALEMVRRSDSEAGSDLRNTKNKSFHGDVAWTFTAWMRRTKGLPWSSARFLAIALLHYWTWREDGEKPTSPFGLNEKRLDGYLARRCLNIIGLDGVRVLSTLQAYHYFTEYLVARDYFSATDAARLQTAAAGFYEVIRQAVDVCDSAYRICPTYDSLINGSLV